MADPDPIPDAVTVARLRILATCIDAPHWATLETRLDDYAAAVAAATLVSQKRESGVPNLGTPTVANFGTLLPEVTPNLGHP